MDQSKRKLLAAVAGATGAAALGAGVPAFAQQTPIRIGTSIAQTGGLGAGGKASLLAVRIWAEDVNSRGGLLGRRVEIVSYDDQSSPANVPAIYAKLLDIDKVDLLIAPLGTNPNAPLMPIAKQRDLLVMGNFSFDANATIRHDKWFNNAPWGAGARAWAQPFLEVGRRLGGKTVAFVAADGEFQQNLVNGARVLAKAMGLQTVYDQSYPPNTTDFSSVVRALRSARPDIVFISSYPTESVAIVRSVREVGLGSQAKLVGGGMGGMQFGPLMETLGSQLNGFVNFHTFVPEKTMLSPDIRAFLKRYTQRAAEEKVDPLGFYQPPFNYAIGQMLEQAVTSTRSLDHKRLADYIRTNEMKTIVGNFRYDAVGEWADPQLLMIQFRGLVDRSIDQFRQEGRQVILAPGRLRSGDPVPFADARK
ncbi:branched-chain amino acid ABC transporter substrate-binding protein [Variovorax sp. WS11]|uniref:amino acid ABC transporter substrate-binding protein n=1 Tax=Variovorax sp. WS11 TaxID=1105204 RepID=UPI000D0D29E1|nr:amino acid ABC transporter substrate-binding protein [Variovorax sp. WS11]NDZ17568.1 ABC transporter substrate-binding protein [Variovorax sp. WS11]PSL82227.1 branched-chain amino acid ABC transporter substrate-binding protein [Variovorax sp. WS11]